MIVYVKDMIKASFRVIGVLAKSETPEDDEYADALQALNFMLDLWSVRSLMVLATILENFPLVANQRSYTIGIGKDFNTTKPSRIDYAFTRDSNNNDQPLRIIEYPVYNTFEDKMISAGTPEALAYDPGATQQLIDTGTVFIYPLPPAGYTLFMGEQKPLVEFSTIEDLISIQPAYYELIKYQLAIRQYREYHEHNRPIPDDITGAAASAMKVVETMNAKQVLCAMDFPGSYPSFNIYTGDHS